MCKESERLDIKHCREQKCREGLFEDYIIINVSPSLFIYLFYLLMSLSYGSLWIIDCQWGGHRQNTSDHYGGIWKSGKFSYDASKLLRQPSPPLPFLRQEIKTSTSSPLGCVRQDGVLPVLCWWCCLQVLILRFSNLVFNVLQNSQDPVQEMAGKVVMDQDPALRGLGLGQTTGGR